MNMIEPLVLKKNTDIGIVYINGVDSISPLRYGVKSSSLNNLPELFKWIPKGFVMSKDLSTRISLDMVDVDERIYLKKIFDDFFKDINSVILRSSSSLEWVEGNSYAGLFKSIRGIHSFDEMVLAIKEAHSELNNNVIQDYAEQKSAVLPEEHMAFLIQEEIHCSQSALLIIDKSSDYLEFYENDILGAVSGDTKPTFSIHRRNGIVVKQTGNKINLKENQLSELTDIIENVRKSLDENNAIHLEVAFSNTSTHILQINNLKGQSIDNNFIKGSKSVNLPSKAESMAWFHESGLFKEKLKVYDFSDVESLYKGIIRDFDFDKKITVRFSYKNDINLPRGFFVSSHDLKNWLKKINIATDWKVIVHEYLCVRRSFELLLEDNKFLLEHIPGMWESDNTMNPDVIYSDEDILKTWVWNKERDNIKFVDEISNTEEYRNVLGNDTLLEWQLKLSSIIPILKEKFKNELPLNFHFVENENKEWSFLNIRQGFIVNSTGVTQMQSHVITSISDIDNWDKKSPLQLQVVSKREDEQELIDIINKLPKVQNKNIIIEFGLLSHPAMILREFGYNLIPSYLYNPDRIHSPNYISARYDMNDDPIKRIMREESLYEDDDFKVVYDREPITNNHLLVLSKHPFTSMIENEDLSSKYEKMFMYLKSQKIIDNFILIERGRAKFCTSGFTDSHAHAHILPIQSLKSDVINSFVERISANKMPTIEEAIKLAKNSDNEYIMLLKDDDVFLRIMPDNTSVEKQLIRNFFNSNKL